MQHETVTQVSSGLCETSCATLGCAPRPEELRGRSVPGSEQEVEDPKDANDG